MRKIIEIYIWYDENWWKKLFNNKNYEKNWKKKLMPVCIGKGNWWWDLRDGENYVEIWFSEKLKTWVKDLKFVSDYFLFLNVLLLPEN